MFTDKNLCYTVSEKSVYGESLYMKKSDFIYKTIQLVLYILLAAGCLYIILIDRDLYHLIASDSRIRILCIFLDRKSVV